MAGHIGPDHVRCLSAPRINAIGNVRDLKRLKWVLVRFDCSRLINRHAFLLVSVISSSFSLGKLSWIWSELLGVLSHCFLLISALSTVCILLARSVDLGARLVIITQVVTVCLCMQDLNLVIWLQEIDFFRRRNIHANEHNVAAIFGCLYCVHAWWWRILLAFCDASKLVLVTSDRCCFIDSDHFLVTHFWWLQGRLDDTAWSGSVKLLVVGLAHFHTFVLLVILMLRIVEYFVSMCCLVFNLRLVGQAVAIVAKGVHIYALSFFGDVRDWKLGKWEGVAGVRWESGLVDFVDLLRMVGVLWHACKRGSVCGRYVAQARVVVLDRATIWWTETFRDVSLLLQMLLLLFLILWTKNKVGRFWWLRIIHAFVNFFDVTRASREFDLLAFGQFCLSLGSQFNHPL